MGIFHCRFENFTAAPAGNPGRALKVPAIPLGLKTKIMNADPD